MAIYTCRDPYSCLFTHIAFLIIPVSIFSTPFQSTKKGKSFILFDYHVDLVLILSISNRILVWGYLFVNT